MSELTESSISPLWVHPDEEQECENVETGVKLLHKSNGAESTGLSDTVGSKC